MSAAAIPNLKTIGVGVRHQNPRPAAQAFAPSLVFFQVKIRSFAVPDSIMNYAFVHTPRTASVRFRKYWDHSPAGLSWRQKRSGMTSIFDLLNLNCKKGARHALRKSSCEIYQEQCWQPVAANQATITKKGHRL